MIALKTEAQRTRFMAFLMQQALPLSVEVKPYRPTRSNEQNNYLWGVCYPPLVERTGYTAEEIHEYALGRHFGWIDRKVPKTPRNLEGVASFPRRTTTTDENGKRSTLDKTEFSDFVATVHRIAAEAGVFIPDADGPTS